jgi:hypothetical protein
MDDCRTAIEPRIVSALRIEYLKSQQVTVETPGILDIVEINLHTRQLQHRSPIPNRSRSKEYFMSSARKYEPLPGSERKPVAGAHPIGNVGPNETFEITVRVRPRAPQAQAALLKQMESQPPAERQYLSREQFLQKFGADAADLRKVADYARQSGLTVVNTDSAQRNVVVRGTAQALTKAFPTELKLYDSAAGRFRGHTGAVQIPEKLKGVVEAVFGFDDPPQARPRVDKPGT